MMNYFIFISIVLLFIKQIHPFEYDDEENSLAFPSIRPIIHHLTSSIFDSLVSSNISSISVDQTINLHALGIISIESNTFQNYRISVKTLILSSNSLSYLPNDVLKSLRNTLTNLNLQQNRFYSLNQNYFLRYLDQLRILDISQNQLKEIFKENFIGLKHLDTLILRENQLTYLSSTSFSHCRKIRTLDLSDNRISLIDSNAFQLLNRLKILLLTNNPIGQRSLTNYLFKPLRNLRYLDLENTKLDNLPSFLFLFNQRLQSIKLRHNHFHQENFNSTLKRTFCGTRSLVEIDLVNANIHSLDTCTYHQLPSLRRLYLMNNPLDCTCDLLYFKYGDIHRLLSIEGNEFDDIYLNRWVSRVELRLHLEKAFRNGDLFRLPIDLSSFARCSTPNEWKGYEINNITGIYSQCRTRWLTIEKDCRNYCQLIKISTPSNSTSSTLTGFLILPVMIFLNDWINK